ncbi:MAG: hypothetical protein LBT25_11355 [Candidatus Symbiothrix sp.]|jgi:hypothetical protein|nr:hypothetical protein [Candidatus Symbiothrix sp.]
MIKGNFKNSKNALSGVVTRLLIMLVILTGLTGCGQNATEILKKYEACAVLNSTANKAGISIDFYQESFNKNYYYFIIKFSNNNLDWNKENIDLLSKRFSLVNADSPIEQLDADFQTSDGPPYKIFVQINKKSAKKYELLCFKGIDKSESAELEMPPCFFILSLDRKTLCVISDAPLLADNLFPVDYAKDKFKNKPVVKTTTYLSEQPFGDNNFLLLTVTTTDGEVSNIRVKMGNIEVRGNVTIERYVSEGEAKIISAEQEKFSATYGGDTIEGIIQDGVIKGILKGVSGSAVAFNAEEKR